MARPCYWRGGAAPDAGHTGTDASPCDRRLGTVRSVRYADLSGAVSGGKVPSPHRGKGQLSDTGGVMCPRDVHRRADGSSLPHHRTHGARKQQRARHLRVCRDMGRGTHGRGHQKSRQASPPRRHDHAPVDCRERDRRLWRPGIAGAVHAPCLGESPCVQRSNMLGMIGVNSGSTGGGRAANTKPSSRPTSAISIPRTAAGWKWPAKRA